MFLFYAIDEINHSLVLEYADGGTLREYLRNDAITFKWESQLKFAKEIASAILCLHKNDIVHRDLVSLNNYILLYNLICLNFLSPSQFLCYILYLASKQCPNT